jgi:hypothetical protein
MPTIADRTNASVSSASCTHPCPVKSKNPDIYAPIPSPPPCLTCEKVRRFDRSLPVYGIRASRSDPRTTRRTPGGGPGVKRGETRSPICGGWSKIGRAGLPLTRGATAKDLQAVGARLTTIEGSPQLRATPTCVARQVRQQTGRLRRVRVRRRGQHRTFRAWPAVFWRLWRAQQGRRIVWGLGGGRWSGAVLRPPLLFLEVNRHAPDDRGWSAGRLCGLADVGAWAGETA